MIYLSAQPDDYYFLWQLELQLYNLNKLGVHPSNIHVLIGYNSNSGLSNEFKQLMSQNSHGTFYCYPDTRVRRNYLSSIRPHIIKQHFQKYPELQQEVIFYHDSDVLFREIPDWPNNANENYWYVSDTRSYLDSSYILRTSEESVFQMLCDIVGISRYQVIENDNNAGGAQYILNDLSYDFWNKVEQDSESIYYILTKYVNNKVYSHYLSTGIKINRLQFIQTWCSDMWALYWNALLTGKSIRIDPKLKFCLPNEHISNWHNSNILHYTGVDFDNANFFSKWLFRFHAPFDFDFKQVDRTSCSWPIVEIVKDMLKKKENERHNLSDVTFLIPIRVDSNERLENLLTIVRFINKYFITKVIIIEADKKSKISHMDFPSCCKVVFVKDDDIVFHRTKYNNYMIREAKSDIVALYDADVIIPINQILTAIDEIRNNKIDYVLPYSGDFASVDRLLKEVFVKVLDPEVLEVNRGKFYSATLRSCGGAIFLNRASFIQAGMENENINSWGPEDVERMKRMQILGYSVIKIPGSLYHLPHPRSGNSGYNSMKNRIRLMEIYLNITSMKKEQLKEHVATWPWHIKSLEKWS